MVTGTSGSISHSTTITVNVCDRSTGTSTDTAGYVIGLNCSYNALDLDAKASWNVPNVSEPSSYFCYNQDCDVTISSALTDGSGSSSSAVYAGSLSVQSCGLAGCSSPAFYGFYDNLPNNLVKCSMSVSSGDTLSGEVYNNFFSPTLPSTQYLVFINDITKGTSCSSSVTSSMGRPVDAQFTAQRPHTKLPKFDTVTVSSCKLGFGLGWGCSDADYSGYTTKYTMVNGGNTNVSVGAISSNSFTLTWSTSNGM